MTVAIVQIACCLFNILNTSKTRQWFSYSGAFSRFVWPICEKYLICIHFVHIKLITRFSIAGILHLNGSREREIQRKGATERYDHCSAAAAHQTVRNNHRICRTTNKRLRTGTQSQRQREGCIVFKQFHMTNMICIYSQYISMAVVQRRRRRLPTTTTTTTSLSVYIIFYLCQGHYLTTSFLALKGFQDFQFASACA